MQIPEDLPFSINPEFFKPLQLSEQLRKEEVEGYIAYTVTAYGKTRQKDRALWNFVKEDFEGWQIQQFQLADRNVLRYIHSYLNAHGVFIQKPLGSISYAHRLTSLLHTEDFHEWSEQEIQEQLLMNEEFVSRYNPDWISPTLSLKSIAPITQGMKNLTIRARGEGQNTLFGPDNNKEKQPARNPTSHGPTTPTNQEQPTSQGHAPPQLSNRQQQQHFLPPQLYNPGYTTQHQPHLHSQPPSIPSGIQPSNRPDTLKHPLYNMPQPQFPHQFRQEQQHYPLPAEKLRTQSSHPTAGKLLADLMKIYKEEQKYGGEEYEVIASKLNIFYDFCGKVEIGQELYQKAFSIMLKGRASQF
jgi:hypothetical protein